MAGMDLDRGAEFLSQQLAQVDHKVTRLESAVSTCQDCLEADSLQRMLRTAQLEHQTLEDLLAAQSKPGALSLESLLLQRSAQVQKEVDHLSAHWHRGRSISSGYWEATSKHSFLTDLLRRYHAWESGRPYYAESAPGQTPPAAQNGHASAPAPHPADGAGVHPWYTPQPHANGTANHGAPEDGVGDESAHLAALREAIYDRLRQHGYPEDHLEIVVQPQGMVLVKGYAHSEEERSAIIEDIVAMEAVQDALFDIEVVSPGHCPACRAAGRHPDG